MAGGMSGSARGGARSGRRRRFTVAAAVGAAFAMASSSIALGEGLVGVGQSADGTLVAVATTGDANSSGGVAASGAGNATAGCTAIGTNDVNTCVGGIAVSGTGNATSSADCGLTVADEPVCGSPAAVSGTGMADSGNGASVSGLGPADTGGVAAVSGKNEVDNVNVCSIAFCDDAFNDPIGEWYAVGALIGVGLPYPLDTPCLGVCGQNHYQRDCPEIIDYSGTWRIMEGGWYDINGCPIVLRYGVHQDDHHGWGWIHIQNKPRDWDWGNFTRQLTGEALGTGPRIMVADGYILSCRNYKTSGGKKRTWHVFVDYKGGKGITTVFPRPGHNDCRSS